MGDTLVDGSRLLEQQETFGGRSKVQQVVQQRLLPHRPVITTHSWSSGHVDSKGCCHDTLLMSTALKMDTSNNRDVHPQDRANVKSKCKEEVSFILRLTSCGAPEATLGPRLRGRGSEPSLARNWPGYKDHKLFISTSALPGSFT